MNTRQLVDQYARRYHIPAWVLETIVQVESGFNPSRIGDNGTSFGLLQLHRGGQLGNLSPAQALNARTNLNVGVPYIARAWHQARAKGLSGWAALVYTAGHSGHPDSTGNVPGYYLSALRKALGVIKGRAVHAIALPNTGIAGWAKGHWEILALGGAAVLLVVIR